MKAGTTRFTLDNGLRVVYNCNPTLSMAVVCTLYDVGSRDESADHTGMAHLFEHLMFGGSVNIPDFDGELQRAGGISNAWTGNDYTCFYDIIPAHNIATALWLESDRMLSLAFSEKALEVQRSVVVEEFKEVCLNQPYGNMGHLLFGMCYPRHPYGVPVIGRDFHDIEKTTQADVRQWFFSHYAPDNAVLSIVAGIEPAEIVRMVEKWYGSIPRRNITPRSIPLPEFEANPADGPDFRLPVQLEPRTVESRGDVPHTAITIAYPMDPYGTDGYFTADLLSDILANGKASRFHRNLLMNRDIFASVDASILGTEHPGLFLINARLLRRGEEAEREAIDALRCELAALTSDRPVDHAELTRCLNRLESDRLFGAMEPLDKAQNMARCEMHAITPDAELDRYRRVTPRWITDYAGRLLSPLRSNTLIYRPLE